MRSISRKKSFWKEFYEYYEDGIKIAGFILAIIASVAFLGISSFLLNYFHLTDVIFNENADWYDKLFITMFFEIMAILSLVMIVLIIYSAIKFLILFISKTRAIKRYTYLPLTADEVRFMIGEGIITTDRDYTYYLTDQLLFKDENGVDCLDFTDDDMEKLIDTYEEVFNKPLILDKEYFKKYAASWCSGKYITKDSPNIVLREVIYPFNYKYKVQLISYEKGTNPVVFTHKDNSFEKIENANYIYIK
jgi:hypothetical protein